MQRQKGNVGLTVIWVVIYLATNLKKLNMVFILLVFFQILVIFTVWRVLSSGCEQNDKRF